MKVSVSNRLFFKVAVVAPVAAAAPGALGSAVAGAAVEDGTTVDDATEGAIAGVAVDNVVGAVATSGAGAVFVVVAELESLSNFISFDSLLYACI